MTIRTATDGSETCEALGDIRMDERSNEGKKSGSKPGLKMRVLTAAVGIPVIILILLAPVWVIAAAAVLCSLIGTFEFYGAVGLLRRQTPLCVVGFIGTALLPFCAFLEPMMIMTCSFLYLLVLFLMMLMSGKKIRITDISMLIMGLIYIPFLLSNVLFIRQLEYGNILVWLVFVGSFMTDSGAYFSGRIFGRHKLCPDISPKKTVEGAVGGTIVCGLGFLLFALIINLFFADMINADMSYGAAFVLGLISAVMAQIGDLTASLIKRQFGIKDFGNLFPGHGGMLDRCDSIVMVAPAVFLFASQISMFF